MYLLMKGDAWLYIWVGPCETPKSAIQITEHERTHLQTRGHTEDEDTTFDKAHVRELEEPGQNVVNQTVNYPVRKPGDER